MIRAITERLSAVQPLLTDLGILILRVGAGGMLALGHGWGKLQMYGQMSEKFPDPLGIGPTMSLMGAIAGELAAGLLVALGLCTRLSALLAAFTMGVAAFVIHTNDPIFMTGQGGAKEPALLYLVPFVALVLLGGGRFSLDGLLWKKQPRV